MILLHFHCLASHPELTAVLFIHTILTVSLAHVITPETLYAPLAAEKTKSSLSSNSAYLDDVPVSRQELNKWGRSIALPLPFRFLRSRYIFSEILDDC